MTLHHDNHPDLKAISNKQETGVFRVSNPLKELLAEVKQGIKILHSITWKNNYYFVKASFLKMQYRLFDGRRQIGELKVIRRRFKRFFKVTLDEENDSLLFGLFVLAQSIRTREQLA